MCVHNRDAECVLNPNAHTATGENFAPSYLRINNNGTSGRVIYLFLPLTLHTSHRPDPSGTSRDDARPRCRESV